MREREEREFRIEHLPANWSSRCFVRKGQTHYDSKDIMSHLVIGIHKASNQGRQGRLAKCLVHQRLPSTHSNGSIKSSTAYSQHNVTKYLAGSPDPSFEFQWHAAQPGDGLGQEDSQKAGIQTANGQTLASHLLGSLNDAIEGPITLSQVVKIHPINVIVPVVGCCS